MKKWRESFPVFRHHPEWIYLDSAATAHKPAVRHRCDRAILFERLCYGASRNLQRFNAGHRTIQ